jgi:O-antigen/teichoic acid export membrane protein
VERSKQWARLIAVTGGGQGLVQVIGFITGIVVIRFLSVDQYAFYTLANTMLGTMGILANGGIAAGVMVQGGKVWQDREKLGAVIACGIQLRRAFAFFSFAATGPILVWLLLRNGASWWVALGVAAAVVPAFVATISSRIFNTPLRLHQQVWPLQRISVGANLLRLAGTIPVLFAWPAAIGALLVNGIAEIFANRRLRRAAAPYANLEATPDAESRVHIVAMVRRILPNAVYFSFSSQLGVFLVSFFGSAVAIAQLGALSRIGMALALVKAMVMTLVIPRFTKLPEESPLVVRRFCLVQGMLWIAAVLLLLLVYFLANPILWILGPEYGGLRWELMLMMAGSLVALTAFTTERLNESRGWVIPPQLFIPAALILQMAVAAALRPATAATGFAYALIIQLGFYAAYVLFFVLRASRQRCPTPISTRGS